MGIPQYEKIFVHPFDLGAQGGAGVECEAPAALLADCSIFVFALAGLSCQFASIVQDFGTKMGEVVDGEKVTL